MQFIWTYWHEGAKEDELRWSIRSVKYFFPSAKITVVGDRAPWYKGHLIQKPKMPLTRDHNSMDVISKIECVSTHSQVEEEFVWMMDDIYFLNPCSIDELKISRASMLPIVYAHMKRKKWKSQKNNTFRVLAEKGFPTHDFATHLPHVVEKQKLKKMFLEFNVKYPLLWEVLYGNVFRETPIDCSPFLHTQSSPVTIENLETATRQSVILNHGNKKGWTQELRNWLETRYPKKTECEI